MNYKISLNDSYLDIVFSGKNKTYGAYAMRVSYNKRICYALLIFIFIISFFVLFTVNPINSDMDDSNISVSSNFISPTDKDIILHNVILENKKVIKESNSATIKSGVAKPTLKNSIPTAVDRNENVKTEIDDVTVDTDTDLESGAVTDINGSGRGSGITGKGMGGDVINNDAYGGGTKLVSNEIVDKVDVRALPPASYMDIILKRLRYPEMAKVTGIHGIVLVTFVVEKDGSISNVKLKNTDPGGGLGAEAIRVVKLLPAFKPAMKGGVPVRAYFTMPIKFSLTTDM